MDVQAPGGKCTFYLEKKKRKCNFDAKPGTLFCGNHMPGGARIPCPINPNHTILGKDLEAHVLRCPERLRQQKYVVGALQSVPLINCLLFIVLGGGWACVTRNESFSQTESFFSEDINAGQGQDVELHEQQTGAAPVGLAAARCAYATKLGKDALAELVDKVTSAWHSCCSEDLPKRIYEPEACRPFMTVHNQGNRPFSIKHAKQQASIIGNMEAAGMLALLPDAVVIEVMDAIVSVWHAKQWPAMSLFAHEHIYGCSLVLGEAILPTWWPMPHLPIGSYCSIGQPSDSRCAQGEES
eukprot:scaffold295680_cov48-Prasinocladus_malaysianus.AAC.1